MIQTYEKNNILSLRLARPAQRNALTLDMIVELKRLLDASSTRNDISVIVIDALGDLFCAGADIEWMKASASLSVEQNEKEAKLLFELLYTMTSFPKPIVARVKGSVYGGGVGLIAACDAVVADETATFCMSEVKLGLTPSMISPFVIQKMGYAWFKHYALTANVFGSREALSYGLVSQCEDSGNLDEALKTLLSKLLKNSPSAMAEVKMLTQFVFEQHHWNIFSNELPKHIAKVRSSSQGQEGLAAFLEKRKPSWVKS